MGLHPLSLRANHVSLAVQDKLYYKLMTAERVLVVNIKNLENESKRAQGNETLRMTLTILRHSSMNLKYLLQIAKRAFIMTCDLETKAYQ